jgi:RNA polymerase sigma-70 factor (ECF subfamily)
MLNRDSDAAASEAFRAHERFVWGLSYRMTGSSADADDVVPETFVRVLERPPAGDARTWRPWLVRVALNLSRDLLRRRRRQSYVGPWLPAPIETPDDLPAYEALIDGQQSTEGRYDLLESVSFAFLLALEALTPRQRAVLLLMDVFDYSGHETAAALDMSEGNVKVTHHRARKSMAAYDRDRQRPTRELQQQVRDTLQRFMAALVTQDVATMEKLLAADVVALSDGGGVVFAARVPLKGPAMIVLFYSTEARKRGGEAWFDIRTINGMPALVGTFKTARPREPQHTVMQFDLDRSGRISRVYAVVAPAKLGAVKLPAA